MNDESYGPIPQPEPVPADPEHAAPEHPLAAPKNLPHPVVPEQAQPGKHRGVLATALVAGTLGLSLLGVTFWQLSSSDADTGPGEERFVPLSSIGTSAAEAGCRPVEVFPVNNNKGHRVFGEPITYPPGPPTHGPHWPAPISMERKFYTSLDRPPVEQLVHNLEHGFTILWYDSNLPDGQIADIKAIASKFPAVSGVHDKFLAVPWNLKVEGGFPEGTHMALTHWLDDTRTTGETGVRVFCGKVSGAAVKDFTGNYPFRNAPEGGLPGDMGGPAPSNPSTPDNDDGRSGTVFAAARLGA